MTHSSNEPGKSHLRRGAVGMQRKAQAAARGQAPCKACNAAMRPTVPRPFGWPSRAGAFVVAKPRRGSRHVGGFAPGLRPLWTATQVRFPRFIGLAAMPIARDSPEAEAAGAMRAATVRLADIDT